LEELLPKDNENIRLPFVGALSPAEPQGFPPDQMIRCEECLRANPPTRVNCLYCAATLPLTEASARLRKPILRAPRKGQPGYNNIFIPETQSPLADDALTEAADLLQLTRESLQWIVSERTPLPLARTDSSEEAALVVEKLRELGLDTITLSDEDLGNKENCVTHIRSLRFADGDVMLHQAGTTGATKIAWADLVLLVPGRLLTKRIEVKERKSRKAENDILDTSEFFADEAVVDLYASSGRQTWRICSKSFDFSCLQQQKSLIASENLATLVRLIRTNAPQVDFDDSYNLLRQTLEPVWPSEQVSESSGWRREGPGEYNLEGITTSSNEGQFTGYSRLRYYLRANLLTAPR